MSESSTTRAFRFVSSLDAPWNPRIRRRSRLLATVVVTAISIVAIGCSDTGFEPQEQLDPLVQRLIQLGFRADMIEDRGDHFVVEGDIMIAKSTLQSLSSGLIEEGAETEDSFSDDRLSRGTADTVLQQWRRSSLVGTNNRTITVNLQDLSATWQTPMRNAMADWNSIAGSTIEFVETTGNATITVTSFEFVVDVGDIARGSWPAGGRAGPTVHVNTLFDGDFNNSQERFIMVHELGHNVGFRHTNWQTLGEGSAIRIGATPQTDAQSVMNGRTGGNSWNGFSFWDIEATRAMYNFEPKWRCLRLLNGNCVTVISVDNGHPHFYWLSVPAATSYKIEYTYFPCDDCSLETITVTTTATEYVFTNLNVTGDDTCMPFYRLYARFPGGSFGIRRSATLNIPTCQDPILF